MEEPNINTFAVAFQPPFTEKTQKLIKEFCTKSMVHPDTETQAQYDIDAVQDLFQDNILQIPDEDWHVLNTLVKIVEYIEI